jgi:hypothetical protein
VERGTLSTMPRITREVDSGTNTKWRYSTFFITINTNQPSFDTALLESVINRVFGDDEKFYHLLDGSVSTIDRAYSNIDYTIERGSGPNGKIHSHILINLRHHTVLRMRIPELREVLCRALKLENVHIDVQASGNPQASLLDYIRKAPL